jgi:hypothetical protein
MIETREGTIKVNSNEKFIERWRLEDDTIG